MRNALGIRAISMFFLTIEFPRRARASCVIPELGEVSPGGQLALVGNRPLKLGVPLPPASDW